MAISSCSDGILLEINLTVQRASRVCRLEVDKAWEPLQLLRPWPGLRRTASRILTKISRPPKISRYRSLKYKHADGAGKGSEHLRPVSL
ncbi:unnamed protein product [Jaminaea pallidilutea]